MSCFTSEALPRPATQAVITLLTVLVWFAGFHQGAEHLAESQEIMTNLKHVALYGSVFIVVLSVAIYAGRWAFETYVHREIQTRLAAIKSVVPISPRQAMLNGTEQRYALEIRALGIAVDNYWQDGIWNRIERLKDSGSSVVPSDASHFPSSSDDSRIDLRAASEYTFERIGNAVVTDWPVPAFAAEPAIHRKNIESAGAEISSRGRDVGLAYTYFLWEDDINSDDASPLIDKLFAFFDANPEVPEAVIISSDADSFRCRFRPPGEGCPKGARTPDVITSLVTLLVSRTDRVDRHIRPFARYEAKQATNADQVRHDYIKQYLFYGKVEQEFIKRQRLDYDFALPTLRSDYWIAQLPRLLPTLGDTEDTRPTRSPYLPLRWMTWQLETFDKAPLLGYLHRPVTIRLRDDEGKPLKGAVRAEALHVGWQQSLASLPEGHLPQRVFHDRTADGGLRPELSEVLLKQPTPIDLNNVDQGYDIGVRIGNTGISSPFVQIALATIAGYKTGEAAATVHRRENGDVTITMVSPPDAETKAAQEGEAKVNPFTGRAPQ